MLNALNQYIYYLIIIIECSQAISTECIEIYHMNVYFL